MKSFDVIESNKDNPIRTDIQRNLLDTQLIQLSHIFKEKFIIKVIDNKIVQCDIQDRPYEDRIKYKILIEIKNNRITFKNGNIPVVCIIKGWFNKKLDTFFIGLEL